MTASVQQTKIINLYAALFNRAPDAIGLNFWAQALQDGASLDTITQNFLAAPEARAIYPATQSSEQFIATFYQSVFGRVADANGLKFWTDALNAAGGADSDAAKALVVSHINDLVSTPLSTKPDGLSDAQYAETLLDRATFSNKLAVGTYFAIDLKSTDIALAKLAFSGVNASTSSVALAKQLIDSPVSSGSPGPSSSTLPATRIGTDGDDVFDLDHLTASAADVIDGLGGNDTLNYVDSSTTGTNLPAVARNVETINIRNTNTAGVTAEQVFFYGLRDLTDGQKLSIAGVTITASGTATAAQIVDAIASGNSVGNAIHSGALNGYTASKSDGGVIFVSSVKGDVPDLVATVPASYLSNLQRMQGTNGMPHVIEANRFVGATLFNSDRSTVAVTFNGLASGQVIGSIGDGVLDTRDLSGTFANDVKEATAHLFNAKGGLIALNGAGLTSAVINSNGVIDSIYGIKLAAGVTALTINATSALRAGGIEGSSLKTIKIVGTASSVSLDVSELPASTSIDASGLTTGGIAVQLRAGRADVVGGSGMDIIKLAAYSLISGVIDAGAGDKDTIEFSSGSSTSLKTAVFRNFEIAQFRLSSTSSETFDVSLLPDIHDYRVAGGSVTLSKLAADASVTVNGSLQSGGALTLNFADTSSTADSASVTLDNNGVSLPFLRIAGIETLKLHSLNTGGAASGSTINSIANASENTSLSRVVIDGDTPIIFQTGSLSSGILTIDASAATGALDVRGLQAMSSLHVTGGSAADKIQGGSMGGNIYGGAGGDAISLRAPGSTNVMDTVIYKNSSDSILDIEKEAGAVGGKMDAITGFHSGLDKIDLTALITKPDGVPSYFEKSFTSASELAAAAASANFYTEGTEARIAVAARISTDTYLIVDVNKDGVFNADGDLVIKLIGTTLREDDLIFASVP